MTHAPISNRKKLNPPLNCAKCKRLKKFRELHIPDHPDWHNAPVGTWYPNLNPADKTLYKEAPALETTEQVKLLIVGMAPGLKGANRTGRPFTGDYAGDLLYSTLLKFGFAEGEYLSTPNDSMNLINCAITNAVRCVPPQNKPIGEEVNNCRPYLENTLKFLPQLKIVLTLGKIAHDTTLRTLGERVAAYPFKHNVSYDLPRFKLISSYHCSRYNTNTGVLTTEMFEDVFEKIRKTVDA
jgi:uracil-DNA glycosylase family 4